VFVSIDLCPRYVRQKSAANDSGVTGLFGQESPYQLTLFARQSLRGRIVVGPVLPACQLRS